MASNATYEAGDNYAVALIMQRKIYFDSHTAV